jgi:TonB family protein
MLGVLLESSARRQRRTGGAALSVALHVAIVGAVTAMTVPRPTPAKMPIEVIPVHIDPTPTPKPTEARRADESLPRLGRMSLDVDVRLHIPVISDHLPPIEVSHGPPLDSLLLAAGGSSGGDPRGRLGRLDVTDDSVSARAWSGREAMMRVIRQAKPRYPESLRQAAIDGHVLVQFKVDTLGRIDPASITVLSSTHELFTRAVREALGGFQFRPAEVNGHRVIALAQMPFEFAIRRN